MQKANILLIDDDQNKLDLLEVILKVLGQNIIKCKSGADGLRVLLENEIAVIILDVKMPVLDGFETASLIRDRTVTSAVPIIFITAYSTGEIDVSKGYSLGAVDYILFPFNETFLLAKIKVFLDLYFLRKKEIEQSKELFDKNNELKLTLENLKRSNTELEQFAYIASHDLQEPLRVVSCFTQLLEKKYQDKLDKEALEYIGYAVDGAKRMQRLVSDLLDYSKISRNTKNVFEVSDTSDILNQSIENLQKPINESNAKINFDKLPSLWCNKSQVQRLFQNLISNSLKFRREGVPPEIHISCQKKNGSFIFSVKDNGTGIPSEYHERIFEIFQRVSSSEKVPGSGMGLSICKRIVEGHNGKLWLESQQNQGTIFYFTLNG